jgi:hypothetical protein
MWQDKHGLISSLFLNSLVLWLEIKVCELKHIMTIVVIALCLYVHRYGVCARNVYKLCVKTRLFSPLSL